MPTTPQDSATPGTTRPRRPRPTGPLETDAWQTHAPIITRLQRLIDTKQLVDEQDEFARCPYAVATVLHILAPLGYTDTSAGSSRLAIIHPTSTWLLKISVGEWVRASVEQEEEVFSHLMRHHPHRVPATYWLTEDIAVQERLTIDHDRAEAHLDAITAELAGLGVEHDDLSTENIGWRGGEWVLLDGGGAHVVSA